MKKNLKLNFLLLCMASTVLFASCGGDDENGNSGKQVQNKYWTIYFDANGGSITTTKQEPKSDNQFSFDTEERLSSPEELGLTYDGHLFYGWNTQADGTGAYIPEKDTIYSDGENIKVWFAYSRVGQSKGGELTLYALWLSIDETAASANADGTYTVTPYNFEATLKAISDKGATEASFSIKEVISTYETKTFEKNTIAAIKDIIKKYENITISIDLSKSLCLKEISQEFVATNDTFSGCKNLKTIILPDSLTMIGRNAFSGCENLAEITLPANLHTIETDAFSKAIEKVMYNGTMENWLKIDFNNGNNPVSYTGTFLFNGEELKEVSIPDSVTEINSYAFRNITSIEKITIPSTVTKIGAYAFASNHNLKEIEIPEGVTSIHDSTFWCCTSLEKVTIPSTVTEIDCTAFYNCNNLSSAIFKDTHTTWYYYKNRYYYKNSDAPKEELGAMSDSSSNAQKLKNNSNTSYFIFFNEKSYWY